MAPSWWTFSRPSAKIFWQNDLGEERIWTCNQRDFKRYTTEEIRQEFLIENLYVPDEVVSVYSHVDRMITLGCMPVREAVPLEKGLDV